MQVHITQQYADRTSLWSALLVRLYLSVFQYVCFPPAPDQADQTRVSDSMFDKAEHPFVTQAPEKVLQIRLQNPFHFPTSNPFMPCCQCLMGASTRPTAKRAR